MGKYFLLLKWILIVFVWINNIIKLRKEDEGLMNQRSHAKNHMKIKHFVTM